MKQTLLVTLDFPPVRGGVSRYYDQLSKHLPKDSLFVLSPQSTSSVEAQREYDAAVPFRVIRKAFFWKAWPHWLPIIWHTGNIVRKYHIEHILVGQILPVGTAVWFLILLSRCGLLPKFSYTVMTHAMDVMLARRSPCKLWLTRHILAHAHAVTCVSTFTQKQLRDSGVPENRLHLLPPGVTSMHTSERNIRKEFDLEDAFVLLSVGRLVARKGYDQVIAALAKLIERCSTIHYVIVGSGEYLPTLRALVVDYKLSDRVHCIGEVSDTDLASFYAACDVFILPTRSLDNGSDVEGFGIVFLEAAFFGKPVIAGKTGGVADAVVHEKTGLLIDPENITEIAAAVERLYRDASFRARLGAAGKKRVLLEFQWPVIVKKLEALIA